MKLILCADQKNGLLFNRRRQSQDRELRKRILSIIGDEKLYLSAYSAGQFTETQWMDRLVICEEPKAAAEAGAAWYFAEGQSLKGATEARAADAVILYRWDRVYPADTYLDLALPRPEDGAAHDFAEGAVRWRLAGAEEFAGYSHEKITEETYIRG